MPSPSVSTEEAVELPPYPQPPTDLEANVGSSLQKPFPIAASAAPMAQENDEQDVERLSIANTIAVNNDRPRLPKLKNIFRIFLECLLADPLKSFMGIIILTCIAFMVGDIVSPLPSCSLTDLRSFSSSS
jgi:hypothetical protein